MVPESRDANGEIRPVDDGHDAAYGRMSFCLTYRYEPKRRLGPWGMDGGNIPNAYAPTVRDRRASGDWSGDIDDWGGNPYRQTFANAVNEAVHEALEWVKVDGKPFLDPHGRREADIYDAVRYLVDDLWKMVDHDSLGTVANGGSGT